MKINNPTSELIYNLYAGKTTNLNEIKNRCGLSSNEVCNAVSHLRNIGIADSDGTWNMPITLKEKGQS
jgi:predicted transcriptional regulator